MRPTRVGCFSYTLLDIIRFYDELSISSGAYRARENVQKKEENIVYQLKEVAVAPSQDPGGGLALAFHFYRDGKLNRTVTTRRPYKDSELATLNTIIEECGAFLNLWYGAVPVRLADARTIGTIVDILRHGTKQQGAH